jgi:hypothetical protein
VSAAGQRSREGVLHFRVHGKGDKIRYIPVGLIAQRLINDYLEAAKHKADLDGALFRPTYRIFKRYFGALLPVAALWKPATGAAGAAARAADFLALAIGTAGVIACPQADLWV